MEGFVVVVVGLGSCLAIVASEKSWDRLFVSSVSKASRQGARAGGDDVEVDMVVLLVVLVAFLVSLWFNRIAQVAELRTVRNMGISYCLLNVQFTYSNKVKSIVICDVNAFVDGHVP